MTVVRGSRAAAVLVGGVLAIASAGAGFAAGGQSTPGAVVTAVNPDGLMLALTAHSEKSTSPDPSCRPSDATIRCWGSLVLRSPGGLAVTGIEIHRVALGDTGCDGGEEGGDECGGHTAATAPDPSEPSYAAVRGVATLADPGDTGMARDAVVQVFIDLSDGGRDGVADRAEVRVRPFVEGPVKPDWAYDSGWQPVQQVQIRALGGPG